MEHEPLPHAIQLTGIHINFDDQAIEFEDRHGTVGRLRFTGETVLNEGRPLLLTPTGDPGTTIGPPTPPVPDQPRAADPDSPTFHNPSPRIPRGGL